MIQTPTRRAVLTSVLGIAMAVGLTFGAVACSSTTSEQSAPTSSAASSSAQQPTAAVPSDVMAGADGIDRAATPSEGGAVGPTTGAGTALPGSSETVAAPVSTAGPIAPIAGNINEVVAEAPVTTAPPVALSDAADFGGSITASLSEVVATEATAAAPGEIGGPAVAVTVKFENGSAQAIGLGSVTVTLTDSAGNPASSVDSGSTGPLAGVLGAGDTATGQYVFSVPTDLRSPVTITVTYSSGAPTLVFTGEVNGG